MWLEWSGQVSQQEQLITKQSKVKTKRQHTVRLMTKNRKKSAQTKDSAPSNSYNNNNNNKKKQHVNDTTCSFLSLPEDYSSWQYISPFAASIPLNSPYPPPLLSVFIPRQRARRQLERNSVAALLLLLLVVVISSPSSNTSIRCEAEKDLICCVSFSACSQSCCCCCCCTHHLDQSWAKRSLVAKNCLLGDPEMRFFSAGRAAVCISS